MSESKDLSIIKVEVPESVDNAIKNISDLPSKSIGQTLADCWYLTFGGLSQLAEKKRLKYAHDVEIFKTELKESINSVPQENRIEPKTQIILPALENAKYCVEEDELRKMFVKLITSSTDSKSHVHPSFSHVIVQLNHLDAKILAKFKTNKKYIFYPICDYEVYDEKTHTSIIPYNNIFILDSLDDDFNVIFSSITSLIRLGLLEIIPSENYPHTFYDAFKEVPIFTKLSIKYPDRQIKFRQKVLIPTEYGSAFIKCCVPD